MALKATKVKPCKAPITIGDLCCGSTNCCEDEPTLEAIDLEAWIAYQNGTPLDVDSYSLEELAILQDAQTALDDAWETVASRTCNRFRPGSCAAVRLCAPWCEPCPPCSKCAIPACYDLAELCRFIDLECISSAQLVSYTAGGTTAVAVDLPHGPISPCASWRISYNDCGQLELCPQRQSATEALPTLPANDISIALGNPGTSALYLHASDYVPAEVRKATQDLACIYLADCHADSCSKIDPDVAQVSGGDGRTYTFDRPTAEQLAFGTTGIQSLDVASARYGCKGAQRFIGPCDPESIVKDVRWVCECPPQVSCE